MYMKDNKNNQLILSQEGPFVLLRENYTSPLCKNCTVCTRGGRASLSFSFFLVSLIFVFIAVTTEKQDQFATVSILLFV